MVKLVTATALLGRSQAAISTFHASLHPLHEFPATNMREQRLWQCSWPKQWRYGTDQVPSSSPPAQACTTSRTGHIAMRTARLQTRARVSAQTGLNFVTCCWSGHVCSYSNHLFMSIHGQNGCLPCGGQLPCNEKHSTTGRHEQEGTDKPAGCAAVIDMHCVRLLR